MPPYDLDGNPRTTGQAVDIGAYEYGYVDVGVDLKLGVDGGVYHRGSLVVTAAFDDCFCVESDDRLFGIRVDKSGHGLSVGMRVNVDGTPKTNADGERYVEASFIFQSGQGSVQPISVPSPALCGADWFYDSHSGFGQQGIGGGAGLNNIGLLIRTWGNITAIGDGYIYIDDGANIKDGTRAQSQENIGVRIACSTNGLTVGDYLCVTGISSCFKIGNRIYKICRLVRVAQSEDITPVD